MRNKFVYSCSVKVHALETVGTLFWVLLVVEAFSLQKVVEMLEKVAAGRQAVKWMWWMRQNFVAWIVWRAVGCCHGEELGPFFWPVLAAGIAIFSASHQFAEHTSQIKWFCWDSESCFGSDGHQTTNSDHELFGRSLALGKALELLLSLSTELVITGCCIKSTFHCMSQSNQEMVHFCW